MKKALLLTLAGSSAIAVSASAQLVITEVMANSSHPGGAANGDWWELTNTGGSSVDLTDYYWDDDGPTGNDGAVFPNVSIAAGQSIVIVDENSSNLSTFIADWGGGFTAISKDDFTGPDDFSGISAGGDQIQVWDADPNAGPANLVAEVLSTGDQSSPNTGFSFAWDTSGNPLGRSADGVNGAYVATGDGDGGVGTDVGSPGFAPVPEPEFYGVLFGAFALAFAAVRRRRA
jgi:hypothetical protein